MELAAAVPASQLDRLLEVSQSLVRVLDPEAVLVQILDAARELTGARFAALGILDEERAEFGRFLASGIGGDEQRDMGPPPSGHGLFGTVIREMRPVRAEHLTEHPDSAGFPNGHPSMQSFLGVPVIVGTEIWGVIYCAEQADREFTAEHERLLVILSSWAAIAVRNADLYARSEADRAELQHALLAHRATREVAQAIGSDLELDHVLALIAERGRPLVKASTILVLLEDGHRIVLAGGAGEAAQSAASHLNGLPLSDGHAPAILERLSDADRAYWSDLGAPNAATALISPMIYRGRLVGVLAAFRTDVSDHELAQPFTTSDQELLESYAASAATRVTIARSVQRERLHDAVSAADAERRRWARELHDQTLQGLAGLRLLVANARLDGGGEQALSGTLGIIDDEIAGLRAILADLRPATLDERGLAVALDDLAQRHRQSTGPEISVSVDPAVEQANGDLLDEAFRIAQEAMTNAVRHAQASKIAVSVAENKGALSITVKDDGQGFDPGKRSQGLGLVGMRERVELVGGRLNIQTGSGGTDVTVTLAPR